MTDLSIIQFMQFSPQQFPYVTKHDWWQHYPLEGTGPRCDLEIWLSRDVTDQHIGILKICCLNAQYTQQDIVFQRFEHSLHLGVKSIRDRQWEGYIYAFIDQETGMELFECASFETWIVSNE